MFENPDYLQIGKRRTNCVGCGASLVDAVRHPSVLVERENPATPIETVATEPELREPQTEETAPPPVENEIPETSSTPEEGEEAPSFVRLDYCEKCWNEMKQAAYFSFWVGRRTENDLPARKLNRTERNLALAALFDSLSERPPEEGDFKPHLYFLAHLLMKYRIFKWQPSITDPETGEIRIRFVRADSGEEILLPEVDMPDEMIVRIKQEVEAYLEQSTGQEIRL